MFYKTIENPLGIGSVHMMVVMSEEYILFCIRNRQLFVSLILVEIIYKFAHISDTTCTDVWSHTTKGHPIATGLVTQISRCKFMARSR